MSEVNEVAKLIAESVDPGARIIFGTHQDRKLKAGQLKVTLVATGFNGSLNNRGNILFPAWSTPSPSKRPLELEGGGEEEVLTGREGVEREKSPKEKPLFGAKATATEIKSKEKNEEVWDIPAFLRRKRRRPR
jgi:cell division protein FtsZ